MLNQKILENDSVPVIDENEKPTNSLNVVKFLNIQTQYDCDEDVIIKYTVAGEWAPCDKVDSTPSQEVTTIRFTARHLLYCIGQHSYQILYVDQQQQVLGASKRFSFLKLSETPQRSSIFADHNADNSDNKQSIQRKYTKGDVQFFSDPVRTNTDSNGIDRPSLSTLETTQVPGPQDQPEIEDDAGTKKVRFLVEPITGTLEEQTESSVLPACDINKLASSFERNETEEIDETRENESDNEMKKVRFLVESVPSSVDEDHENKKSFELLDTETAVKGEYQIADLDEDAEIRKKEILETEGERHVSRVAEAQLFTKGMTEMGTEEEQMKDQWIQDQITELNTIKNTLMTCMHEEDRTTSSIRSLSQMQTHEATACTDQIGTEFDEEADVSVTTARSAPFLDNNHKQYSRALDRWQDIVSDDSHEIDDKGAQSSADEEPADKFVTTEDVQVLYHRSTAESRDAERAELPETEDNYHLFITHSLSDDTQAEWETVLEESDENVAAVVDELQLETRQSKEKVITSSSMENDRSEQRNYGSTACWSDSFLAANRQACSHCQKAPSLPQTMYQQTINEMKDKIEKLKVQKSAVKVCNSVARTENCEFEVMLEALQNTLSMAEEQLKQIMKDKDSSCVASDTDTHSTFLSDLLYTLRVRGFASIITREGEKVDLRSREGVLLELKGFDSNSVKRRQRNSSREIFMKAVIGSQESSIQQLTEKVNQTEKYEDPQALVKKLRDDLGLEKKNTNDLTDQVKELQEKLKNAHRRETELMEAVYDSKNFIKEKMHRIWSRSVGSRSDAGLDGPCSGETSVSLPLIQPKDSLVLYREPHGKAARASDPVIKSKRATFLHEHKEATAQNSARRREELSKTQAENNLKHTATSASQSSSAIHRRANSKTNLPTTSDRAVPERPKSPRPGHRTVRGARGADDRLSWKRILLEDETTASKVSVALACPHCHQVFSASMSTGEMRSHIKTHKHHDKE